MAATSGLDRRTRTRLWLLAAAMVVWAVAYLLVLLVQGTSSWWSLGLFTSMALIPAILVAVALRRPSPRGLAAAIVLLAAWSTILGILGLVSLIGLPLLLVGFLAFRTIPACADGREGRPDRRWSGRVLAVSLTLGLACALVAIVGTILSSP
jgi:hypothetical protein